MEVKLIKVPAKVGCMEVGLIKVPAKAGCMGCWYEDSAACPVKRDERGNLDFTPCFDSEQNCHMIFISEDQKNEG